MRRLFLLLVLLSSSIVCAEAQDRSTRFGEWRSDAPQSVSLSIGALPMLYRYTAAYRDDRYTYGNIYGPDYEMVTGVAKNYGPIMVSSPAYTAEYKHRLSRKFSYSVALSYAYEKIKRYGFYDDQYQFTSRSNIFMLTAIARYHWLNTKRVSLYSSLGLGFGGVIWSNDAGIDGKTSTRTGGVAQLTPIGCSWNVSDKCYIFGEAGVGSLGTTRFGVGYRL